MGVVKILKCTVYPKKVMQMSTEQLQNLMVSLLYHVDRAFTYNTSPVELTNRILSELLEADLIDITGTGCEGCSSCGSPVQTKETKKKPGKVIQFPNIQKD